MHALFSPRWAAPRRSAAAALAAFVTLSGLALVGGCAAPDASAPPPALHPRIAALLPADVLLLGESHDAPDHQRLQRDTVQALTAQGQLAAVVMEMADAGRSTTGLPRDATEAQVQTALQWKDAAWPWQAYGPVVMAAVRAGVPVWGGNLPRERLREAMAEPAWDRHLPAAALQRQYEALREGHCGLLPEAQIAPMARIQIARDASLARTAQQAAAPGRTVLLIAGSGHVQRSVGVPTHLPPNLASKVALAHAGIAQAAIESEADALIATPALPAKDPCADLRERWGTGARPVG